MKTLALSLIASLAVPTAPLLAGEAWDDIRPALYGERSIEPAGDILSLSAPYRATDDREVPIEAAATFADGRTVKSLSIIIDDNPMPVSAVFDLEAPEQSFGVTTNMRINGPTPIRVVVEASDGQLYMSEGFVKTSGLGACAAPPVNGIDAALASLGEMKLIPKSPAAKPESLVAQLTTETSSKVSTKAEPQRARLEMKHPSHSGMQMDQITLLYILARYVETVEVWTDEDKLFTMTGSISLSEDPEIEFTYSAPVVDTIKVRMTDTDDTVSEHKFPLGES